MLESDHSLIDAIRIPRDSVAPFRLYTSYAN
jgi:hypothetical protein